MYITNRINGVDYLLMEWISEWVSGLTCLLVLFLGPLLQSCWSACMHAPGTLREGSSGASLELGKVLSESSTARG
jgi:hypothetical protein